MCMYVHVCVRIRGLEMLVFRKILRTYLPPDTHKNQHIRTRVRNDSFSKILANALNEWFLELFFFLI